MNRLATDFQTQAAADALTAILKATIKEHSLESGVSRWVPSYIVPNEKQIYLLKNDFHEVHYGGTPGGGKTSLLLMAALKYVDVPGYRAIIIRRTMKMFEDAQGIKDQLLEWVAGKGAVWNETKNRLTFPSGATITFGHLDHDRDMQNFISGAYHFWGFDQLEQINPKQYRFLFSRRRKNIQHSTIPLRTYSTSNADPGALWVFDYFIDGATVTNEWIHTKRHYPDDGDPYETIFVPAFPGENPGLDWTSYEKSMAQLSPEERIRLEAGDWTIRDKGDVFSMYSAPHCVITYSEFKRFFGIKNSDGNIIKSNELKDIIPLDFSLYHGLDWGHSSLHKTCASYGCRPHKGNPLDDSIFVYRELTVTAPTESMFAKEVKKAETLDSERLRFSWAVISHEADTEQHTLSVDHGLHYSSGVPNSKAGLTRMRSYMTLIDKNKPHPFRSELFGRPRMYFLVADGQGELMERENYAREESRWYTKSARDASGLVQHRSEIAAMKWKEDTRQDRPEKGYDDAIHACRNWVGLLPKLGFAPQEEKDMPPDLRLDAISKAESQAKRERLMLLRGIELAKINKNKPVPYYKRRII